MSVHRLCLDVVSFVVLFYNMCLCCPSVMSPSQKKQRRIHKPLQCGNRLHTSKSDVRRRQILTYKGGPRAGRIKIFIMTIYP